MSQKTCAESLQTLGDCALSHIGTTYLITQIEQHFGYAAHAGATNTDEMNMFNLVFHQPAPCIFARHTLLLLVLPVCEQLAP